MKSARKAHKFWLLLDKAQLRTEFHCQVGRIHYLPKEILWLFSSWRFSCFHYFIERAEAAVQITAPVWSFPQDTSSTIHGSKHKYSTSLGVVTSCLAPWPRAPVFPQPHVNKLLFAIAAEWYSPHAILLVLYFLRSSIKVGKVILTVFPPSRPHWPNLLQPIAYTYPVFSSSSVWLIPQATFEYG